MGALGAVLASVMFKKRFTPGQYASVIGGMGLINLALASAFKPKYSGETKVVKIGYERVVDSVKDVLRERYGN